MPINIITNNNKGDNISENLDEIDLNMLDCVLLHCIVFQFPRLVIWDLQRL